MKKISSFIFALCIVAISTLALASATTIQISPSCNIYNNCTQTVVDAIHACSSAQSSTSTCTLTFEAATYNFNTIAPSGPYFWFNQLSNVTLQGQDSNHTEFIFDNINFFFALQDCKGMTFSGFSVDMKRVPYTLGKVVSNSGSSSVLVVPDQDLYPTDAKTQQTFSYLNRGQAIIGYDPTSERFTTPDVYDLSDPLAITYDAANTQMMTITGNGAGALTVGAYILVRHQVYVYNAINGQSVTGLTVNDVVLYSAGGMGVLCVECSEIALQGFQTRRRRFAATKKVRAMSITADGIHISNSRGGSILVDRCILEGQGDDGLNANTPFGRIVSISADRKSIQIEGYSGAQVNGYFRTGDVGEIFNGRTMAFCLFTSAVAFTPSVALGVTFSTPLPSSIQLYDLIVNNNAQAVQVRVSNSKFLNNRARGILMKQSNAIMIGNTISGQTSPAILSQIDGCFWMEGRPFVNWFVVNNQIDSPDGFGPATVVHVRGVVPVFDSVTGKPTSQCQSVDLQGVFANISMTGNTISSRTGSVEKSISVYATEALYISGNFIISPGKNRGGVPDFEVTACSVVNENIGGDNRCYDQHGNERDCFYNNVQ